MLKQIQAAFDRLKKVAEKKMPGRPHLGEWTRPDTGQRHLVVTEGHTMFAVPAGEEDQIPASEMTFPKSTIVTAMSPPPNARLYVGDGAPIVAAARAAEEWAKRVDEQRHAEWIEKSKRSAKAKRPNPAQALVLLQKSGGGAPPEPIGLDGYLLRPVAKLIESSEIKLTVGDEREPMRMEPPDGSWVFVVAPMRTPSPIAPDTTLLWLGDE